MSSYLRKGPLSAALIASAALGAPAAHAAFLGANGRIAFSRSAPRANPHIFAITPSRHGLRQLTTGNFLDLTPSWSPGGTVLAFSRLSPTGGLDVFTVLANGSGLTQITRGPAETASSDPAWSPDARSLAFTRAPVSGKGPSEIYRMRTNGTGVRRLTDSAVDSRAPAWTSGLIAYVQGEPPNSSIWTMRPDGSHRRRLTGLRSGADDPDFSPTGTMIVFDRKLAGGRSAIYVMDRNGRRVRRIHGTPRFSVDPVFAPDGVLIAFSAGADARLSVYTISLHGRGLRRITGGVNASAAPSWQPVLIAPL